MLRVLLSRALFLSWVTSSYAVTGNDCAVPKPCDCVDNVLNCRAKGLMAFPSILTTSQAFETANFKYNFFKTLEDGSFSNITVWQNRLSIDLSDNNVNYVSSEAFRGLEDVRLSLQLQRNKLTSLPAALSTLNNLTSLRISGITTFDPTVMNVIGPNLETFAVGDLNSWPTVMRSLTNLKHLSLYDANLPGFLADNVKPFAKSLYALKLSRSTIKGSLDGICALENLGSLQLNVVNRPQGVEAFPACPKPFNSLKHFEVTFLKFVNASLLLPSFPALTNLTFSFTALEALTLPQNNKIQSLVLSYNQLTKFPLNLDQTSHLQTLELMYNHISSVQKEDLSHLTSLRKLVLRGNPLGSIHQDAFMNNPNLEQLDLQNTRLAAVPKAISRIGNLQQLLLLSTPVRCSCAMSWMLNWRVRQSVSLTGYCLGETTEISTFVKNKLPLCEAPIIG